MNLIKLKDIILDETSNLTAEKIEIFNKELKGKYAYIVNWQHIVSFDRINQEDFVKLSIGEPLKENSYIDLKEIPTNAIDLDETNYINNVDKYRGLNKYTTDPDITIDEIKKFRPWLAYTILQQGIKDEEVRHMLQFYNFDDPINFEGSGMYDDVVKYLNAFGNTYVLFNNTSNKSSCGCNNSRTVLNSSKSNIVNPGNINFFDVEKIYKMNIYVKMIDTFKNIEFWEPYRDTVLVDMKNYIDNIIKVNLPLYSSKLSSNYAECGCLNQKDIEQQTNIKILFNLSQSLQYIINDEINEHKNFIKDSLLKWASTLYEKMYWLPVNNIARPMSSNSMFMYVKDGDIYIKGVDSNNNRMDYKLLSGQSVVEPIDDNDIVTGDYLEDYIQEHMHDRHIFQDLNDIFKSLN
jgi:hypothetical protein